MSEQPERSFKAVSWPGTVLLQRRTAAGEWETLSTEPASRQGRTPITLPQDASPPFRVVFSPKNPNATSWVSEPFDR